MQAVLLEVRDVVDDVDDAGKQAENNERFHAAQQQRLLMEITREDQSGEHHQVLGPLVGTHRREDVVELLHVLRSGSAPDMARWRSKPSTARTHSSRSTAPGSSAPDMTPWRNGSAAG